MALLKNKLGLSYGDITTLMKDAWDMDLTRGAAAHIVRRAGERAEPVYDAFQAIIPQQDTVYADETGWKVGGQWHWLWDFVIRLFTVYAIGKASRRNNINDSFRRILENTLIRRIIRVDY